MKLIKTALLLTILSGLCGKAFAGGIPAASPPYGHVVPVSTLTNTATYAANAAAINSALALGGKVFVTCTGEAYVSSVITPGSNTDFEVEKGCTLGAAPGLSNSVVKNMAQTRLATSPTTVTTSWTSGITTPLAMANHGLVVGDYVWIFNNSGATAPAGQTAFIGVFPVLSVTDANDVVIRLRKTPTANASYALTAVKADSHLSVKGQFDYNYPSNAGSGVGTQAVVLAGANDVTADVIVSNALKYGLTMEAVNDWHASIIEPLTNSDGIKIYGPAFDGEVVRAICNNGDDCVSLQPKEATGFLTYPLTEGDIIGVRGGHIRQVANSSTANILALYGHGIYTLDDVDLTDVTGNNTGGTGVYVTCSGDQTNCYMGKIAVRQISDEAVYPVSINGGGSNVLNFDNLTIEAENTVFNGNTTTNAFSEHIHMGGSVVGQNYVLRAHLDNTLYGTTGTVYYATIEGSVTHVTIDNPYFNANSNVIFLGAGSGSATKILNTVDYNGGVITGGKLFQTIPGLVGFTNTPEVIVRSTQVNTSIGLSLYASVNGTFQDAVFNGLNLGIVRFNGTYTSNIYSYRTRLLGSTVWVTVPSGTPTLYPWSPDISLDVTQTYVGRAIGGVVYNTNASAGTLGQAGVVDSTTTATGGWKLRGGTGSY